MAAGLADDSIGHWFIIEDGNVTATKTKTNKPPYHCPTIKEISAAEKTGLVSCSAFSGAGGSCTGFEIAGFRVAWANEFVDFAAASYYANHRDTILDQRDIRKVKPEEILEAIGMKRGEVDVCESSPPCDSFSTAGKRQNGWGKEKNYRGKIRQRTDNLFDEWLRILKGLKPRSFMAENVSGMAKGAAKGKFIEVIKAMKTAGYRVKCQLLDAQWLGVPQVRKRFIFIGIRNDLDIEPQFPKPIPWRYSVRDALPNIGKINTNTDFNERWVGSDRPSTSIFAGGGNEKGGMCEDVKLPPSRQPGKYGYHEVDQEKPSNTVTVASPGNDHAVAVNGQRRKFTIAEVKRLCAFPDDYILRGSYANQWSCCGMSVPPVMAAHIAASLSISLGVEPSPLYWTLPGANHAQGRETK